MSHVHEVPPLHEPALAMIVLNGAVDRLSLIPTCEAVDCRACIAGCTHSVPDAYCRLNSSFVPAAIPSPQLLGPVPADLQVVTPFELTSQPWSARSSLAWSGLYGYGLFLASVLMYGFAGFCGTGP